MARPEGSGNKNKSYLLTRLKRMYGDDFHPIMKMARNAVEAQKELEAQEMLAVDDPDLKPGIDDYAKTNNVWDQIAVYTEPKLKAIEVREMESDPVIDLIKDINNTSRGLPSAADKSKH